MSPFEIILEVENECRIQINGKLYFILFFYIFHLYESIDI